MKGLAKAAPRLERVKVLSRTARKHYGSEAQTIFDASLGHLESHKWVSDGSVIQHTDAFVESGIHTVLRIGLQQCTGISKRSALFFLPTQKC